MITFLGIVFLSFVLFHKYWFKVCHSPYDMTLIFGKKRSGKTTLLQKLCLKHKINGWKVYSNFELFGSNQFNIEDFGKLRFPPHSLILVDEVSLIWSNRDFKEWNKKRYIEEYFRHIGHYKNKVILCSQSFDVDKKLRDLTDNLYLLKCIGGYFTIALKIRQSDKLHRSKQGEEDGSDKENFITKDFHYCFPTSWIFTFNPRYFMFFNSFALPSQLPLIKDKPYIYDNFEELLAYTNYIYYKKVQIINIKDYLIKKYQEYRSRFYVDYEVYKMLNIIN